MNLFGRKKPAPLFYIGEVGIELGKTTPRAFEGSGLALDTRYLTQAGGLVVGEIYAGPQSETTEGLVASLAFYLDEKAPSPGDAVLDMPIMEAMILDERYARDGHTTARLVKGKMQIG